MVEAVRISETSVNFNVTTRCYIPEDYKHLKRDLKQLIRVLSLHVLQCCNDLEPHSLKLIKAGHTGRQKEKKIVCCEKAVNKIIKLYSESFITRLSVTSKFRAIVMFISSAKRKCASNKICRYVPDLSTSQTSCVPVQWFVSYLH
jgi:hypothetical protein